MRFKMKQVDDNDNNLCIICRTKHNLIYFREINCETLGFYICHDCLKALCTACAENGIFINPNKAEILPTHSNIDVACDSYKSGYREGYRDGFRDNYELHD